MRRRSLDALTQREREVLALVRLGLTNEEIAWRLGISLDGAKYHVSQILSKLGVATREEAAAAPVAEAFEPRRRWWGRWPVAAKIAGAATVAAAAAGLAVLAWGVLRTGGPTDAGRGPILADRANPIPWSNVAATSVADPFTIRGVPACQAADLGVEVSGEPYIGGGAWNTSSWTMIVRNRGTVPCFVGSTVAVSFATAGGKLSMSAERTGGDIVYLAPPRGYLQQLATPPPGFSDRAGGRSEPALVPLPRSPRWKSVPGPAWGQSWLTPAPRLGWALRALTRREAIWLISPPRIAAAAPG